MDANPQSTLVFFVNGQKVEDNNINPQWTLLQYLRQKLRLCGAKLGCGEGGCGACTVMVSKYNRFQRCVEHISVNACLAPVASMHGLAVTTVEGIGSTKTKLHPVQERFYKAHGSQCGFCTPGIIMSMYTLLRNSPQPSLQEVEDTFQGNLCRCTGYRPILQGFQTFTKELCCGLTNGCCRNINGLKLEEDKEDCSELLDEKTFQPYDPSQEPIFPPELQISDKYEKQSLLFEAAGIIWCRPVTLHELLTDKVKYPTAKITAGNTEVGVEVRLKHCHYPVHINPSAVQEMMVIDESSLGVTFGAATPLTIVEKTLIRIIQEYPEHKTRMYSVILEMLTLFAGPQIRNVATLGGNLATASPIADLNPLLVAAGAEIHVATVDSERCFILDQTFFRSYRTTALQKHEVIVSIHIPFTNNNDFAAGFKQSQRFHDDIAIVNAGMYVTLEPEESPPRVRKLRLVFGGMAPTTVTATKTASALIGKRWTADSLDTALRLLEEELPLNTNAPGGMVDYRRALCLSFFFKFFNRVVQMCPVKAAGVDGMDVQKQLPQLDFPKGSQIFTVLPNGEKGNDPVGQPLPHRSGAQQTTGEAVYLDDISPIDGELYCALVTSTHAHARIINIDPRVALAQAGVRHFVSSTSIKPDRNALDGILSGEFVFCPGEVTSQGQIIGAVLADDEATARNAARLVAVHYEDINPCILTIEEAIDHKSFFSERRIRKGDADAVMAECDCHVSGEIRIGGQEHFYLEPNGTLAIPRGEDGEVEIVASTQNPSETQSVVAHVLGVSSNKIVCRVKRIGGGFGGKETRSIPLSAVVAVAAVQSGRPVRCILSRDEDMVITGTRNPCLAKYKVGFTKQGSFTALIIDLYFNGGFSSDLSVSAMDRALLHIDNCYRIPHVSASGRVCKTHLPSNTAFRGFGGPQAMFACETLVQHVASYLNKPSNEVREINMYRAVGDSTHFNQLLEHCTIQRCWNECLRMSNYTSRRETIQEYNSKHEWRKRGLAIIPTKFGIAFTAAFLNQAGALVHIYKDGSVLITHGGVEMGQGLHVKMIQVAARVLGIDPAGIHISETSTDKVPNASPTAASASSDLYGMAVKDACQIIKNRLQPIVAAKPKSSWIDWITAAYMNRISLSATGFYRTPDLCYDFETNSGRTFNYFTYGVACSEVEIDCLTGHHQVIQTDIVMDVGESLNPAIDIGQIEGGFIQGYGLFTIEQTRYLPNGAIITRGPGNYKIPAFSDIPNVFNVALLKGSSNINAVFSSKAIGEPPLFLAASVFFAIKDAILQVRAQRGLHGYFRLDSPATAERIRMLCEDQFTVQILKKKSPGNSWEINI